MNDSEKKTALEKEKRLLALLESYGSVAVAFSGGVDSTYLLDAALRKPGKAHVRALTAATVFLAKEEQKDVRRLAKELGISPEFVEIFPLEEDCIFRNPKNRCYHCKQLLFSTMKEEAASAVLIEGSNKDDADDFRPGARAVRELGIQSPLAEVGMTKEEIRFLSKERGIRTWDKPSLACLASRIPYGQMLTKEKLAKVDAAEEWLHEKGFSQLRVRVHEISGGLLARIELMPEEMDRFFSMQKAAEAAFSKIGFSVVTPDLKGYRMGSLNEGMSEEEKTNLMR